MVSEDQGRVSGGLLSEAEAKTVILALVNGMGGKGASEKDIGKVLDWATQAKIDAGFLSLVLSGQVVLSIKKGEIGFQRAVGEVVT